MTRKAVKLKRYLIYPLISVPCNTQKYVILCPTTYIIKINIIFYLLFIKRIYSFNISLKNLIKLSIKKQLIRILDVKNTVRPQRIIITSMKSSNPKTAGHMIIWKGSKSLFNTKCRSVRSWRRSIRTLYFKFLKYSVNSSYFKASPNCFKMELFIKFLKQRTFIKPQEHYF